MKFRHRVALGVAAAIFGGATLSSYGITVTGTGTSGGAPVSATMDFTVSGNVATLVVTNTTLNTLSAAQLLTAVDLTLSGVSNVTLISGSGIERTVDSAGAFTDFGTVNLMTAGNNNGPTWSVNSLNGGWRLSFNPNAEYAILGAPTAGSYSGANGSINNNPGHNPYIAQTATFQLTGTGLTEASLTGVTFRFGTDFSGSAPGGIGAPPPVPEPASTGLLALGVVALGLRLRLRPK